jgi:hypothetical protein
MKNIHLLPTNKPSRLFKDGEKLKLDIESYGVNNQNIYITSDEEIKEGDWQLSNDKHTTIRTNSFHESDKKIILTTDEDLINGGVQSIDDEFLEWFVKNPSCEEVGVQKGFEDGTDYGFNFLDYKIIIPNN